MNQFIEAEILFAQYFVGGAGKQSGGKEAACTPGAENALFTG
jgi:hypothetical protein